MDLLEQLQGALTQNSYVYACLFAFLGGIAASLTPCIYPMIPITVGFFGTLSNRSRSKIITLSILYVLGISVTYTALGIIASIAGILFGSFSSNPWILVSVGIFIILMGLSQWGIFDISTLAFFGGIHAESKKDFLKAFLMGLVSGVIASPCTTPILITLLSYVAIVRSVGFGSVLLFSFSIGMGLLLILISLFTSLVMKIPRPGPWMEKAKKINAWIIILFGCYILYLAWTTF